MNTNFAMVAMRTFVVILAWWLPLNKAVAWQDTETLTPEEGVEAIEEAIERSKSPDQKVSPQQHAVSGRFVTSDGTPVDPGTGGLIARSRNSGLSAAFRINEEGRFEKSIQGPATFFVHPTLPGFAQKCYGPFELSDKPLDVGDLELKRGFSARLVIQNEEGEPVSGVKIDTFSRYQMIRGRKMGYGSPAEIGRASDAAGVIEFQHLTQDPIRISLTAPGFEEAIREIKFQKNGTVDWKLTSATPLTGQFIDKDGNGVPGVEVWLARKNGPQSTIRDPRSDFLVHLAGGSSSQLPLAVSDSEGKFQVDSMRSDTQYWFMSLHKDYQPSVITRCTAGDALEPITMTEPLVIQGRIKGDLSTLGMRSGKPYFYYRNVLSVDDTNYDSGFICQVEPDGAFEIRQLLAGQVHLTPGSRKVSLTVKESIDDLVIDLDKPLPTPDLGYRKIRIRIKPTAGQPLRGEVQLSWRLNEQPAEGPKSKYKNFPASEVLDWEAPPGAEIGFQGSMLIGSIVEYTRMGTVTEGDDVQEFAIELDPAGLASGQVVDHDGTPISAYRIDVDRKSQHVHAFQVHALRVEHPEGRFAAGPLPLGDVHQYQAFVQPADSWRIAISEPFLVTAEQPVFEQTIKMPRPIHLIGRVLNAYGEPAASIPITMSLRTTRSSRSVGTAQRTDRDGRFRIPISSELTDVKYQFAIQPHGLSAGRTIEFRGDEFIEDRDFGEIRLQPSATIRGFVLDETGKPRSNVTVNLKPVDSEIADFQGDRRAQSNANGAFEITGVERVPQLLYLFGKELVDATAPFRIEEDRFGNQRWMIDPSEREIDVTIIVKEQ